MGQVNKLFLSWASEGRSLVAQSISFPEYTLLCPAEWPIPLRNMRAYMTYLYCYFLFQSTMDFHDFIEDLQNLTKE